MNTPDLHDATLIGVTIGWSTADVRVEFRASTARIELEVGGVVDFACPHKCPWGASNSVNECRVVASSAGGLSRIEIEMQSGDTISIVGSTVDWRAIQSVNDG